MCENCDNTKTWPQFFGTSPLKEKPLGDSQVALVVKNPPADAGDPSLIPGSGRYPGGGHGNPLQYSCLKGPMDRGVWRATVHIVTESDTTELTKRRALCIYVSCPKSARALLALTNKSWWTTDQFVMSVFTSLWKQTQGPGGEAGYYAYTITKPPSPS